MAEEAGRKRKEMSDDLRISIFGLTMIAIPVVVVPVYVAISNLMKYHAMMILLKAGWTTKPISGTTRMQWIAPDGTVMNNLQKAKRRELMMQKYKELKIPERELTYEAGSWR